MRKVYVLRKDGAICGIYTNLKRLMAELKRSTDHPRMGRWNENLNWEEAETILGNTADEDEEMRPLDYGLEELILFDDKYTAQAWIPNEYTEPDFDDTHEGVIANYLAPGRKAGQILRRFPSSDLLYGNDN